jgi:hypothetical protein
MALALGALGQLVGHFVNVPPFATLSLQPSQFAFGAFLALPLFGIDAGREGGREGGKERRSMLNPPSC